MNETEESKDNVDFVIYTPTGARGVEVESKDGAYEWWARKEGFDFLCDKVDRAMGRYEQPWNVFYCLGMSHIEHFYYATMFDVHGYGKRVKKKTKRGKKEWFYRVPVRHLDRRKFLG